MTSFTTIVSFSQDAVIYQDGGIFKVSSNHQTRETVFHHIPKHWEESWKYDAQRSIFEEIRVVWKCDETLARVFDISSQSKLKLRSKRRNKIVKIYANPNHGHGYDFFCFNLMNILMRLRKYPKKTKHFSQKCLDLMMNSLREKNALGF